MKTVRYSPDARRALNANMAGRLLKAIADYADAPSAHPNNLTRLVGSPARRLRVGDFRIVFEETETEIVVTKIGPRGSIYD